MKIKLSKNQWKEVGKKAGWIKKEAIFGPGFVEDLGSQNWKDRFGKPITTKIIIDGAPLVMSTQMAESEQVVIVEHNGQHIGVYYKGKGFTCTYTKDLEKYMPFKKQIDQEAQKVLS